MRRTPRHGAPAYRQLWRVVEGAVADALDSHPDYLTARGARHARHSVTKRVVGAVLGYAEQSARGRSRSSRAARRGRAARSQIHPDHAMDLYWTSHDFAKRTGAARAMDLYAGCLDEPIATLRKREKHWEAVSWLPGLTPSRRYAPLDEQRADVEMQADRWFGLANTWRPATDAAEC